MYQANKDRYQTVPLRHAGRSGLLLPAVSLGLWRHFDETAPYGDRKALLLHAFDAGVFHFDVADHYGEPEGSTETLLGQVLATDLKPYRDELVIATKGGFPIHEGPYGIGQSRKAIMQHVDGSLRRLQTDYVDVYYAHRFDAETPLEETVQALNDVVRQGKAMYIGISNFETPQAQKAIELFAELKTPLVLNQMSYNMFNRNVETTGLLDTLRAGGVGLIAYGPLSEGLLSDRYLNGFDANFSIHHTNAATMKDGEEVVVQRLNQLNQIAKDRGQTLSQMALAWLLRDPVVISVIIGTTSPEHLDDNLKAAQNTAFSADELAAIDAITKA